MSDELFFERARRVERELAVERELTGQLVRAIGEKDVEIARLRESLQTVIVAAEEFGCGPIRAIALDGLRTAGVEK